MDDLSRGKETRSLAPFLDLLDLHDLIQVEEEAGKVSQSALVGRPAPEKAAPAAPEDGGAHFSAKLGPLPSPPPAPAPDQHDVHFHLPKAEPAASPQTFAVHVPGTMAVQEAATAKAAAAGTAAAGAKAGQGPAQSADVDNGPDVDIDGIRVRIKQDADIDQDTDASVEIRGDDVEVSIRADAEMEVNQDAAIALRSTSRPPAAAADRPTEEVAIAGRQAIDIDSSIEVDVTGYTGEIVMTIAFSEDADVDQDIRAIFRADAGDDVFDIDVSQYIDVDLLSYLDIDIRMVGGRLHVDIFLKDVADGVDSTTIEVTESGDDILDIDLRQRADVDQRVSVDLDVEQELARLFDIDVDVDAEAEVVVRQAATVEGVLGPDGSADWDVDGGSEIEIENQIRLRIDLGPA